MPTLPSLRLLPQRQRFLRFGAVVESHFPQPPSCRPSGRHCPSASLPQRQHFPRFGAVVDSPFLQHPSCRPSGRHSPSASLPQRQHFPRFGAVVDSPFLQHPSCRPSGRHSPSASLPQRQHFPRFGAVVESPIPLRPFYRPSGRHCRHFLFPQRQQIPRFGAVVGCGLWVRASGQSETNVKTGQRPKKADCVQNRPVSKLDGKNCDENCMTKQVAKIEWRKRDGNQNEVVVRKTDKWGNSQNVAVVEEIGRLVDLSWEGRSPAVVLSSQK